jgi:hypothetical protein
MPISRGQMPRQMYGLGSLVKSITKGAKSAVKGITSTFKENPLLGLAALNFAPMLAGAKPFIGMGSLAGSKYTIPGISSIMGSLGLDVASGAKPTLGQFGKVFAIGSLGGAALQALTASGADEEELGNIRDVESLKSYLRQGYKQLNPQAEPEQVEAFVETNTTEYRADGGRIGFAEGMPEEGIETLLPKQKPSQMMQEVDSVTQSVDNFAQLIAQSGDPSSFRGHVDLLSEFIQKNDIDPSAAFDYVKRRVDEIKPGLSKFIFTTTEDMPVENKAYGGRIGYSGGTKGPDDLYTRSYKRVMELMDEGYDFGSAVKKYMEEEKERENKSYGGRIGYDGGTDFQKWLEGKQKFDQGQNAEQLYREYLEDKRRQKVAEQKTMAANGGRIGFFKGAQADARAGRGAMSPGTSMSGGFRGGGDGGGNKDTTPKISEVVKNISNLSNVPAFEKISNLESRYGLGSSGLPSRARHMAAMNVLSNALSKTGLGVAMGIPSKLAGDMGAFGMGLINEIPALGRGLTKENLSEISEDIVDNFRGTFLTPNTMTTEQIYSNVYGRPGVRQGGRIGYAFGNPEQNAMEAAGIEGLPLNQNPAGVKELDLRDSGGFIPPVGVKEKADDIPAMLSNNEFVFTADAVRGMGDGDVNKGAQRMYDMMKKLEGGGRV